MKLSNYNYFKKIKDSTIAFNFMSGALIKVPEILEEYLNNHKGNLLKIKEENPSLFNALYNQRFVMDEDIDEISLLKM